MPVYDCSFPVEAEGLTVTIRDAAGATETSGTLTDDITDSGALVYQFTADEGVYVGSCSSPLLGTLENQAVLNIVASIAAGGGGGVTGPAAWFTFAHAPNPFETRQHSTFTVMDDGRASPRPDLVIVDPEDPTTLNVVLGGEYLISTTAGAAKSTGTIDVAGLVRFAGSVEINGDNEAPAYFTEVATLFPTPDATGHVQIANLAFHQTLVAGDTIQFGGRIELVTAESADATWIVAGSSIGLTKIG